MKKITQIIIAALMLLPAMSFAQSIERDVKASAGDYSTSATMQLAWTVGEVAVATQSSGNLLITEGFQQVDGVMAGIPDREFNADITVYPNPVSSVLNFEVNSEELLQLQGGLYDISGRLVKQISTFQVSGQHNGQLDCSQLAAGKWFLKFSEKNSGLTKTFLITKLN